MNSNNTAGNGRIYGEVRADLLNLPTGETSIDILACAGPDWNVDGNAEFMDRLTQMFAGLHFDPKVRTVVLGPSMQRRLANGGILGSRNIIFSPERESMKHTGLRLTYVDGIRGLARVLRHLRVPHAWVIGDASTYRHLTPYCRRAYIVPSEHPGGTGETMPSLAAEDGWQHVTTFERICGGHNSSLSKYVNSQWLQLEDGQANQ